MVAYLNQVALPLPSFPGSIPHIGVYFWIKDLMFRGGRGACRVILKKNWMDAGVVSTLYVTRLVEPNHGPTELERMSCVYGDYNKGEQRPGDAVKVPTFTTAKGSQTWSYYHSHDG